MVNNLVNSVVGSIYIGADKRTILDNINTTSYQPLSNNNVLFVYLENAFGNSGVVTASFKSGTQRIPTTQPFFLRFIKDVSKVVGGEVTPRHFSKYILTIPQPVANLNLNKTEPLNIHTTINVSSSIKFIGTFNTLVDLTAHVGSVEKDIAYVIESGIYGYYEYGLDNGSLKWLRIENDDISRKVVFSQYGFFDISIQGGYFSEVPHTNINDWQEYIIWQEINQTNYRLAIAETDIDDLEVDLGETKNRVEQNETNIENLKNRVSENENSIDIIENDILEIKSDINEIDGRVGVNETDIYNLESDLGETKNRVEQNETNIENLKNRVKKLQGLQNTRDNAQENRLDTVEIDVANLENQNLLHSPTFNGTNGHLTFQRYGASPIVIDLPTEMIVTSGVYDDINNELVLNLASGGEVRIPVGNLLTDLDAENIRYNGAGTYYLSGKNRVEQAINELDLQVKAVNDNKLDASVYNNDIPLIDAELLRLEDDKANKSELVASDVATSEVGVSVQDKLDEIATEQNNLKNKDIDHEQRIDSIEAITRKQDSDIASVDDDGLGILHMGKDVAETTVTTKIDGLLLDAPQLVTNGDFSDGTTGWNLSIASGDLSNGVYSFLPTAQYGVLRENNRTVVIGNKYYGVARYKASSTDVRFMLHTQKIFGVHTGSGNYEIISNVITAPTTDGRLYILDDKMSGWTQIDVDYMYLFNISTLIANKQYSPLYNTTFDLMSDAQIKAQMDLWVQNGTLPNSIMSVDMDKRVTSVGKNLFDKSEYATDYAYKISVKPSTQYTWSISALYKTYDKNMKEVSSGTNTTLTVASNVYYIAFSDIANIDTFMLVSGSVVGTYENYRSSSMYLDSGEVGYSLPNGVKDTIEFRNGQAYHVQRVKKYTLQASDITYAGDSPTHSFFNLSKPLDYIRYGISVSGYGDMLIDGFIEHDNPLLTPLLLNEFTNYSSEQFTKLALTLGTTLAEVQADLVGTEVYYQLATPIETPISVIGNAMAYPNGTFLIEDVVRRSGVYSSGITVDKAISQLDNIYKLNDDGSSTKLAVSGATIAGDGLSFTHTSLSNGDFVWFDYYYQGTNVKGLSTVYYYGDKLIVADTTTGTVYKIIFTIDNGVITVDKVAV